MPFVERGEQGLHYETIDITGPCLADAEFYVIGHAKHGMPFSHGRECAAILRRVLDRRFTEPNR